MLIMNFCMQPNFSADIFAVEKNDISSAEASHLEYQVFFKTMGGVMQEDRKTVVVNEKFGLLPIPERAGYNFIGWYTSEKNGGERITQDTVVELSSDLILYARWEEKTYQVSFDGNDGIVNGTSIRVKYGKQYGVLPNATKEDAIFLGWYTKKDTGKRVTEESLYTSTENQVLYAHWLEDYKMADLKHLSFGFKNTASGFSYPKGYKIQLDTFKCIYGDTLSAIEKSQLVDEWSGNCFGMCAASIMFHANVEDVKYKDFNKYATCIGELLVTDNNVNLQLTLTDLIEAFHVMQYDTQAIKERNENENNLNELYEKVEDFEQNGGVPPMVIIQQDGEGHAVVGYKTTKDGISIYDPNYPNQERTIMLERDQSGNCTEWYYFLNENKCWGSYYADGKITYITYETIKKIWDQRVLEKTPFTSDVSISVDNAKIYDENGKEVAVIVDGRMQENDSEIYMLEPISGELKDKQGVHLIFPVGKYTVENTDAKESFTTKMVHEKQGACVTTQADKVTIYVDDTEHISTVACMAENGESYSMTLQSGFEEDRKKIEVNGVGASNDTIEICQNAGKVMWENCDVSNIRIDDKEEQTYTLSVIHNIGGDIERADGEKITDSQQILKGESITYTIKPQEGYLLQDVIVDGVSCGNIPTYCFEEVKNNHTIEAIFLEISEDFIETKKIGKYGYTGKKIKPGIEVYFSGKKMTKGTDYTLIYTNNINPGMGKVKIIGLGKYKGLKKIVPFQIILQKGDVYSVEDLVYRVTNENSKEVGVFDLAVKGIKQVTIPKNVKIGGTVYKITSIEKKAFYEKSSLSKIIIKTTTLKKVGENAFKGINTNAVIKVPVSKLEKYKKILKKKGQGSGVKIKG